MKSRRMRHDIILHACAEEGRNRHVVTIEGTVDRVSWCYYDMTNDVLYLRLAAERDTATFAVETNDALILVPRQGDDRVIGTTFVNWRKRFGPLPDSIRRLAAAIESWAKRLAA